MLKLKGKTVIAGLTLSLAFISSVLNADDHTAADKMQMGSDVQAKPANSNDEVDIKLLSESFGHFIGRNLKSPGVQFDVDSVVKGIKEGSAGSAPPMSDQEYEAAMMKLQEKAYEALSKENLQQANDFMTTNKGKEGVLEIVPGKLEYSVLKEGTGPEVKEHGTPLIHYTGKYIDGSVFGSSEEVGGPITIPLDQTIPGFSKGIVGMKEGEKRRLFIHPDLGYGTMGNLPPNALLIFDIDVLKADAPAEQGDHKDLKGQITDASDEIHSSKKSSMKNHDDSDMDKDDDDSDDDDDDDDYDDDDDKSKDTKKGTPAAKPDTTDAATSPSTEKK